MVALSSIQVSAALQVRVSRYSENGDLVWVRTFQRPSVPDQFLSIAGPGYGVAMDPGGDLFVLARGASSVETALYRIAPDGSDVWSTPIAGPAYYRGDSVAVAASGQVIVVGSYEGADQFPHMQVNAIQPDGAMAWTWGPQASGEDVGDARELRVSPTGDILLLATTDSLPFTFRPKVTALDATGSWLWSYSQFPVMGDEETVVDAQATAQGNWVVVTNAEAASGVGGRGMITRFRSGGAIVFANRLSDDSRVESVAVSATGEIFYAAAKPRTLAGDDLVLGRLSALGAFIDSYQPSVVSSAGASTRPEAVWVDGDQVFLAGSLSALGGSIPGTAILASFELDGTERWSLTREATGAGPTDEMLAVDVTADHRGNVLWLTEGNPPGPGRSMVLSKWSSDGEAGQPFCSPAVPNSTGEAAVLAGLGSDVRADDNLSLRASRLPVGTTVLMLASLSQGSTPAVGGGQGTLCLGGAIGRYVGPGQVRSGGPDGTASLQLSLQAIPQPTGLVSGVAGQTWSFQAWYRDANPGTTSNLTNGVAVQLR